MQQAIMTGGGVETSLGVVSALKGLIRGKLVSSSTGSLALDSGSKSNSTKQRQQIDGLRYSHYGGSKCIQDTCFKLHGYPEW